MTKHSLTFFISTLITILLWIGFDLYHSYKQVSLPIISQQFSETVNPDFDPETVNLIMGNRLEPVGQ